MNNKKVYCSECKWFYFVVGFLENKEINYCQHLDNFDNKETWCYRKNYQIKKDRKPHILNKYNDCKLFENKDIWVSTLPDKKWWQVWK